MMAEAELEDFDVVMEFPDVRFHISEMEKLSGSFYLMCTNGAYSFEWRPYDVDLHSVVQVPIYNVSEIIKRELSKDEITLRIIMVDSSRLPRLTFTKLAQIQVTHLIEYLLHKSIIVVRPDRTDCYKVEHESKKTEADIFAYVAPSEMLSNAGARNAVNTATHNSILKKLRFNPTHVDPEPISFELLNISRNSDIFEKGLSPEARPWFWAKALNIIPDTKDEKEIELVLQKKLDEYRRLHRQLSYLTDTQKTYQTTQDIFKVIEYDVKRNDRQLEQFADEKSPNLVVLKNVLTAYAVYNRDAGFVQGMGDLATPMIIVFIKRWVDNDHALFYDGVVRNREETESFVFWGFVGMMEMTFQERVFANLGSHQSFVLKRVAAIATSVHTPLKELLQMSELSDMSFLFRPILLLFKRDFKIDDLLRLWDSMLAYDNPPLFSRFVCAAMLILVYPKLVAHTNGTLGAVMNAFDGTMEKIDVSSVLQISNALMEATKKLKPEDLHFIMEPIPDSAPFRKFRSRFFPLCE